MSKVAKTLENGVEQQNWDAFWMLREYIGEALRMHSGCFGNVFWMLWKYISDELEMHWGMHSVWML